MRARRRAVIDEYVEDGRAAVYSREGFVLLLSELGAGAWGALGDEWVEAEHVAEALVRAFGEPTDGDAADMTEAALRSLAQMDLVDLDEGLPA